MSDNEGDVTPAGTRGPQKRSRPESRGSGRGDRGGRGGRYGGSNNKRQKRRGGNRNMPAPRAPTIPSAPAIAKGPIVIDEFAIIASRIAAYQRHYYIPSFKRLGELSIEIYDRIRTLGPHAAMSRNFTGLMFAERCISLAFKYMIVALSHEEGCVPKVYRTADILEWAKTCLLDPVPIHVAHFCGNIGESQGAAGTRLFPQIPAPITEGEDVGKGMSVSHNGLIPNFPAIRNVIAKYALAPGVAAEWNVYSEDMRPIQPLSRGALLTKANMSRNPGLTIPPADASVYVRNDLANLEIYKAPAIAPRGEDENENDADGAAPPAGYVFDVDQQLQITPVYDAYANNFLSKIRDTAAIAFTMLAKPTSTPMVGAVPSLRVISIGANEHVASALPFNDLDPLLIESARATGITLRHKANERYGEGPVSIYSDAIHDFDASTTGTYNAEGYKRALISRVYVTGN